MYQVRSFLIFFIIHLNISLITGDYTSRYDKSQFLAATMGKAKDLCGECGKGVSGRTGGIQCDGNCQLWFHPNCINLNYREYIDLGNNSVIWICNKCGMHNIGMMSSIGNTSDLSTDNTFSVLESDEEDEQNEEDVSDPSFTESDIGSPVHTSSPRRQVERPKKTRFRS